MTIQELIQKGWADHEAKPVEVGDRLEAGLGLVEDASGAAQLMNLALHAVGDHAGDRGRARRICERAIERLGEDPGDAPLLYLAVARHLDGDETAAREAEARLGDDASVPVRIGMLVAQGWMHGGDWSRATDLYARALAGAERMPAGHAAERATAIVSNNIASALLDRSDRTAAQDALMERAAHAARTFWTRIGTWENDERADYLLALVHLALRRPDDARALAERGLATIAANGEERVDEAFLHLARARACRDAGDAEGHAASLARADELAAGFEDEGLARWFASERQKAT